MSKKLPIFKNITDRDKGYVINIADVRETYRVEVFKLSPTGKLVPIADVPVPPTTVRKLDAIGFRRAVLKEIRKVQSYMKAKADFEKTNIKICADAETMEREGVITTTDLRRTDEKGQRMYNKPEKQSAATKKKGRGGRPGIFDELE